MTEKTELQRAYELIKSRGYNEIDADLACSIAKEEFLRDVAVITNPDDPYGDWKYGVIDCWGDRLDVTDILDGDGWEIAAAYDTIVESLRKAGSDEPYLAGYLDNAYEEWESAHKMRATRENMKKLLGLS